MEFPTLEQVIRQHINLTPRPNGRGFFPVLCKVCNDHGRKGKRAGFKFEGEAVGYNCFNCGHTSGFDPAKHQTMPHDMVSTLTAFGIEETDWRVVLFRSLQNNQTGTAATPTYRNIEPSAIAQPPFFYPLEDDPNDDTAQWAITYLADRKVDWTSYPFMLVRRETEHPDNARWYGRLIIPIYKDNKLIFWQGRDLSGLHTKKYLNPSVDRSCILYGFDQIQRHSEDPLYIVEGWFDAFHLGGVAVFGNKLSEEQIKWINKSHRPKVVIPDRYGDGHLLARQALALGWGVSTPDIGSCKDVNDAIVKYGLLYTLKSIVKNTTFDQFAGEAQLGVYCEQAAERK